MFLKIARLTFSVATISLLVACGGGGGGDSESGMTTTGKIASRDVVSINYNYSPEICSSSDFKKYMINALAHLKPKDFIASVESNSVTCETYGKVNNGRECYESHSNRSYSNSCVTAFNSSLFRNSNKLSKTINSSFAKNAIEMMEGY